MPSMPSRHELGIGGMAAFQAMHAVIEMAQQPEAALHTSQLYQRFLGLSMMTRQTGDVAAQRGFTLALARLLFEAVKALNLSLTTVTGAPLDDVVTFGPQEAARVMQDVLAGQEPDVIRAGQAAQTAPSLPDFIRAIGYGAQNPVADSDLAYAGVLVLRRLLDLRTHGEPMRRWILLGQLSNAVGAAHYLRA